LLENLTRADFRDIGALHYGDLPSLLGWLDTPFQGYLLLLLNLSLSALPNPRRHGLSPLNPSLYTLQLELADHIQPGIAD
jgi:hypothetical protein